MSKPLPRGRNDTHVFDFTKISDHLYIGSDLCKGNVCSVHSEEFRQLGVCVELNLSAEKKEVPPNEIDIYAWLPVVDGYAPSPDQLMMGTSIINDAIESKKTVYVHCKNGHGRSPTMVAAYLIRFKDRGVDEAVEYIKKKRPEIHIEDTQIKELRKFEERWLR